MRKVCFLSMSRWASSSDIQSTGEVFKEQMHALLGTGVFNSDGRQKQGILVVKWFTDTTCRLLCRGHVEVRI